MSEILFRGKSKKESDYYFFSQNWKNNCKDGFVYGSLIVSKDKYYICVSALCQINSCINNGITSMIEVIPETVGQCTGLTDKNGKKIFEGDIIRSVDNKLRSVRWNFETLSWELTDVEVPDNEVNHFLNTYPLGEIQLESCYGEMISEIVGNIHDNPELLKGDKDNGYT